MDSVFEEISSHLRIGYRVQLNNAGRVLAISIVINLAKQTMQLIIDCKPMADAISTVCSNSDVAVRVHCPICANYEVYVLYLADHVHYADIYDVVSLTDVANYFTGVIKHSFFFSLNTCINGVYDSDLVVYYVEVHSQKAIKVKINVTDHDSLKAI